MKNYQKCASCRHSRTKCKQDCLLAPYFPAHMHQKFQNAYQVFGRSYITKLLHNLNEMPQKRNIAMKNIIAEADIRIADPVGGSYRVVKQQCADLSRLQWKVAQQELELQQLGRQVNANVAMAQPSLYQEQGNIVPPRTRQEQGHRNLGTDWQCKERATLFRVMVSEFDKSRLALMLRVEYMFIHLPLHHQQLLPEPNQVQGDMDEVVVPEQDGLEARPNFIEQNCGDSQAFTVHINS